MRVKSGILTLAVVLIAGIACESGDLIPPGNRPVVSVSVTPTTINMVPTASQTLVAAVTNDTTGERSGVTWSSNAPGVATVVASSGVVTGVAPGIATVTATSKFDPTKSAQATVTIVGVVTQPNPPVTLPVIGAGIVSERYTAEIAVKGNFAYTTTWGNRSVVGNVVKIWNVAGATPILVDSLKNTSVGTTSDVQISPDGSLLVISTEGGTGSIITYSLANPAAPAFISRYTTSQTSRGVHTVKLSVINGKLYGFLQIDQGVSALAQEVIVDMSDPANIQQVFVKVMGSPYVHDVFVRDGILFVANWNDGMFIFDVGGGGRGGSPSNPVQISTLRTRTGQIHNIWWYQDPRDGNKKYVFLGEEGLSSGPIGAGGTTLGDIHVVDISNISAPREVAKYNATATSGTHNFWVDEPSGILYAAYYNGGVRALDIRGDLGTCTPAQYATDIPDNGFTDDHLSITGAPLCDLKRVGREAGNALTTGGYFIWGVMMQGTRLYASDMGKGIVVLDASALKR